MTLYETLGIDKSADDGVIKRAYRKLASKFHPDRATGDTEKFKQVQKAYATLSDHSKRERYDRTGEDAAKPDDLEQEAMSNIAMGFKKYLEDVEASADPIKFVRNGLVQARDHYRAEIAKAEQAIKTTKKKEKAAKRKQAGHDMFALLFAERMRNLQSKVDNAKRAESIIVRSFEILDEYESGVIEMPQPHSAQFNAFLSGNFNSYGSSTR